jgi:hypothetical protein
MENFVVKTSTYTPRDLQVIFAPDDNTPHEEVEIITDPDLESLAVRIGAFKSKSQARQAGRSGRIPTGYTEMWINKRRKIWIWNPVVV